jgi:hypothetical protein
MFYAGDEPQLKRAALLGRMLPGCRHPQSAG